MELVVLGSCGSWPGPGRACSGYLMRTATHTVAVDLGPGTLANLQHHTDISDLDGVVLTHAHPDHWTDVTGLAVAMRYFIDREGLPLVAPRHTLDAVGSLAGDLEPTFVPVVATPGVRWQTGDLTLSFATTDHSVPTVAVRVDGPAGTLAYSADTGPNWSFDTLGGGIDVALCEATYTDANHRPHAGHLSATQAGILARQANVGSLVLTHLAPGTDPTVAAAQAEAAFGGRVTVATDGLIMAVGAPD